jgi:diaminobutyrate-2-oxoglutarate transaminase
MLLDTSSGIDHPAAVLLETVQGEGGLNAARVEWFERLQALCTENKILLIVDDIQAGCGRTGTFFSFEKMGLEPDIVTLSKSLSGYGLPFAILLLRRELDIWKPGEHNGTFRGNNHAFVTAAAALEHYWRTDGFTEEVKLKSGHLDRRLKEIIPRFSPHLVSLRGRGMMRGLMCADSQRAAAVVRRAFGHGLVIERSGPRDEVIKFLMPLTVTTAEMDEGLDILELSLAEELGSDSVTKPRDFDMFEDHMIPALAQSLHARQKGQTTV